MWHPSGSLPYPSRGMNPATTTGSIIYVLLWLLMLGVYVAPLLVAIRSSCYLPRYIDSHYPAITSVLAFQPRHRSTSLYALGFVWTTAVTRAIQFSKYSCIKPVLLQWCYRNTPKMGVKSTDFVSILQHKNDPSGSKFGSKMGSRKILFFCENLDTVYLFVYYFG